MPNAELIFLNAPSLGCGHSDTVSPYSHLGRIPVSQSSKIAERLLAHARLCRQIADASWSETTAAELERLAAECERAAGDAKPDSPPNRPIH